MDTLVWLLVALVLAIAVSSLVSIVTRRSKMHNAQKALDDMLDGVRRNRTRVQKVLATTDSIAKSFLSHKEEAILTGARKAIFYPHSGRLPKSAKVVCREGDQIWLRRGNNHVIKRRLTAA